jgi:hypothetical protein
MYVCCQIREYSFDAVAFVRWVSPSICSPSITTAVDIHHVSMSLGQLEGLSACILPQGPRAPHRTFLDPSLLAQPHNQIQHLTTAHAHWGVSRDLRRSAWKSKMAGGLIAFNYLEWLFL